MTGFGFVFVGDIVEENGKTWKQNNLEIKHNIPIGTLVEINYEQSEDPEESTNGLRLFVVNHSRDCDGTPLYDMSFDKKAFKNFTEAEALIKENRFVDQQDYALTYWMKTSSGGAIMRHYGEDSLRVVQPCQ